MKSSELKIPPEIDDLLVRGIWPKTIEQSRRQNNFPIVSADALHRIIPDEDHLHLLKPPFFTLSTHRDLQKWWNLPYAALDRIDPDFAILIAEFSIGGDSGIALDYRLSRENPSVIYLKYFEENAGFFSKFSKMSTEKDKFRPTDWVQIAPDFRTFARGIGLL
jgi:hypothetical protein